MKKLPWIAFFIGLWVVVSPWLLGYWRITAALWSQIIAGTLIILVSLWQIVEIEENHNNNG